MNIKKHQPALQITYAEIVRCTVLVLVSNVQSRKGDDIGLSTSLTFWGLMTTIVVVPHR